MKRLFFALSILLSSAKVLAGGGGAAAGATEITQIRNNVELAAQFAQQLVAYENQLQQYQTMVTNLAAHPLGNILPDLQVLAVNSARVISASSNIGSSMARVDQNFSTQFQSPLAGTFADKFKAWTTNSNNTLKAAMLNAGLQRENFSSDSAALQALVTKNQQSTGNLNAIQTLGEINTAGIQENMKLRDLISQQQIAVNTALATKAAQDQQKQDAQMVRFRTEAVPDISTFKNPKF